MKHGKIPLVAAVSLSMLVGCGQKEEAPAPTSEASPAKAAEIVCSYAPSQSAVVSHLASASGGGAAAAAAIAQATGLTVVMHSSGAYILTGTGGYIAGTLGPAIAGPVLVGVGVVVGGSAGVVELLCAPRNHPELIARVESAATEFFARSKEEAVKASTAVRTFTVEGKSTVIKAGNEAFDYAYRKSVKASEVLNK